MMAWQQPIGSNAHKTRIDTQPLGEVTWVYLEGKPNRPRVYADREEQRATLQSASATVH